MFNCSKLWCDKSWLSLEWHMVFKWHPLWAIWSPLVLMLKQTLSGFVTLEEWGRSDGPTAATDSTTIQVLDLECNHFKTVASQMQKLQLSSNWSVSISFFNNLICFYYSVNHMKQLVIFENYTHKGQNMETSHAILWRMNTFKWGQNSELQQLKSRWWMNFLDTDIGKP